MNQRLKNEDPNYKIFRKKNTKIFFCLGFGSKSLDTKSISNKRKNTSLKHKTFSFEEYHQEGEKTPV
jgi:hypothetical protein